MASIVIAYSEKRLIEPPGGHMPPDVKQAWLANIEPLTDDNLETVVRMLLKQLAEVANG